MPSPYARAGSTVPDLPETGPGRSLTPKLALFVGGLVVAVTVICATAAYLEMRRTAYAIATDRLAALSTELVRGLGTSRRQLATATQDVADRPVLRAYLEQPSLALRAAAESALRTAFAPATQTLAVQLVDRHWRPVLTVGAAGDWARSIPADSASLATAALDTAGAGPIATVGDSAAFSYVARIGTRSDAPGHVVHWRRFRVTGLDQVGRIPGARTDIYIGNRDRRVWTDLVHLVPPPNVELAESPTLMSYARPGVGDVLSLLTPIAATPWSLLVETSRDSVMARTHSFVLRLSLIGAIVLALGLLATVWLSRSLTRPLARLAAAAEQVAGGDYTRRTGLAPRDDELGRLTASFDSMVSRVQQAFASQGVADEYYRRLFESVPLPLWVFDRDTSRFLAVNDVAITQYGYSRDEFLSMTVADVRGDAADRESASGPDADFGEWAARCHRRKDGTIIDVEARAFSIVFDGQSAIIVVVNDVTERNRADEAIRRSEEKHETLIREAPIGITLSTFGGALLAANPAFLEMMGFKSESEAMSVDTRDLFAAPSARADLLDALGHGTRLDRTEVTLKRRDGSQVTARCTIRLVPDPATGEQRIEAISEDVTEQRKIERQFQQAQKMEVVGQLAGGIAHDFNNLLTVIISYGDLMLGSLAEDDPMRQDVLAIRAAGKSAATLTRQLLIFSRQQVLQPKVMRLNDLVADTGSMLDRLIGENIVLKTALDPEAGAVKVDAGQMEQVIVNLAVNARDAMPEGGRLLIESKNVTFDQALSDRNRLYPAGRYVTLAVSDNGAGMDEETQSRIFEPFFTTKEAGKGTGLGLATVYGIVKQSGGYISVYSEVGKGTSFKIYFPRVDASTEAVESVRNSGPTANGTETLLVVEDDDAVRKMVRVVLQHHGYDVFTVSTGDEALAFAAGHAGPIPLVITDVVLSGMSGRVLAERFAAIRPESLILFISGYTDDALIHHGVLEAGMHYLEKPFTPDSLARTVRRVLDGALA